jgi:AcrR family transcriptional regulator
MYARRRRPVKAPEGSPITDQARRSRGKRAGLDLARIVEAARSLDPGTLTMQAVADELGVDRKAVNHHVTDRDSLLELVALDSFTAGFAALPITGQWQEACRAYARGFTDSVIAIGVLAGHLRLGPAQGAKGAKGAKGAQGALATRFLAPTEAVLAKLIEAGLDDETAVRSLALLTNICLGYARDAIAFRNGERPRPSQLRSALHETDAGAFTNLARIAASPIDTYDERQLDLSIEVFLRGTEGLLA